MRALLALAILFAASLPAFAGDTEVDVELVLAVDVSRSMTRHELEIQRRGYAEALRSPEVLSAVRRGYLGRIALTYIEWSGTYDQRVVLDWTLIASDADAAAFAAKLTAEFDATMRRTSISGALDFAATRFDGNGFDGLRQVIDVSGDGPNNDGRPVEAARDAVLAKGIVINGLPLMTREGMGSEWTLPDLDEYYRSCVIGGPGSFVIPVTDWEEFTVAVRMKLVQDIAGVPPEPRLVPAAGYDCLVGEKIWERTRRYWSEP
jgi:Protein of unknown function (DUF1194)